ncbi:unnamed protein product [Closterium sp. NIES-65]|nr:unnamed protein product [Closterium sp. NIES-65]
MCRHVAPMDDRTASLLRPLVSFETFRARPRCAGKSVTTRARRHRTSTLASAGKLYHLFLGEFLRVRFCAGAKLLSSNRYICAPITICRVITQVGALLLEHYYSRLKRPTRFSLELCLWKGFMIEMNGSHLS